MLKIKDSVPLTELEKFGFSYKEKENYYFIGFPFGGANISIGEKRIIDFDDEWWGEDFDLIDTLFDLIKADLVEKVENDGN